MVTIPEYVNSIVAGIQELDLDRLADEVRAEIIGVLKLADETIHDWADGDPYA